MYTTHSRGAAGINYHQTQRLHCVRASWGVRLRPQHPPRDAISHIWLRNRCILWLTNINHVVPCTPRCCPAPERIPALFILKLPPSVTYRCCDLRKKGKGCTGECHTVRKGLFSPHISWRLPISLSDPKLLWVVRPCLWLVLKVMRGSGVCFLFVAPCFPSPPR